MNEIERGLERLVCNTMSVNSLRNVADTYILAKKWVETFGQELFSNSFFIGSYNVSQSPQWFGALTPAKKMLSVRVIEQFDIV